MLAWLRAFDAAARHSSFTRAADELSVSQGAISQQVKNLEQALDLPLFRRGAGLELTQEGRRLATVLDTAFGSIRTALNEAAEPNRQEPVTLSCSPSFAARWLSPRLNRLSALHSDAMVELIGEFQGLNRLRMQSEGLEAAIRYDEANYPDLHAVPFLDEYLLPVASPAFLAHHSTVRSVADLDGRLLLHDTRPWDGAREEEWRTYLDAAGTSLANFTGGRRFNLSHLAIASALADEGVALGRLALVLDDLEAGRLVPLPGPAVRAAATYKFIAMPERSPRAVALENWLLAQAAAFRERRDAFLSPIANVP